MAATPAASEKEAALFEEEHLSSSGQVHVGERPSEEEWAPSDRKLNLKLDLLILPLVTIVYLLAFLDRANIGNARVVCTLSQVAPGICCFDCLLALLLGRSSGGSQDIQLPVSSRSVLPTLPPQHAPPTSYTDNSQQRLLLRTRHILLVKFLPIFSSGGSVHASTSPLCASRGASSPRCSVSYRIIAA